MFDLGNPYALFLLIPVGFAAWRVYRRGIRSAILFAPAARLPAGSGAWRSRAAAALPVLYLAGLVLAVIALARPRTVLSETRQRTDAVAIEMVVDVSGSMEALDLSEKTAAGVNYRTRLDVVKKTFADFIARRPHDLIGLITFGGYAVTRAPLTTDRDALLHVLDGVAIPGRSYDEDGRIVNQEELLTAVGDALATACARLADAEPVSRVIVLLSDGESNTGIIEPEEAIGVARELGITVYTIGIGTTGRAPFQARDLFGRPTVRYANVTLDEALLRKIAGETGGVYFNVRDPEGIETALDRIDTLETTEIERDVFVRYNERYLSWLGPALALIVLAVTLNMLIARRIV
ncbi:MAG: VWA domain-containing protein [Lentisphaerae bacterium]|nr:VWA domain-containing protein [Lentisphaerota bacterium]